MQSLLENVCHGIFDYIKIVIIWPFSELYYSVHILCLSVSLTQNAFLDLHSVHLLRVCGDFIKWLKVLFPQSHGCREILCHGLSWGCCHQKHWDQVKRHPPLNCWIEILVLFFCLSGSRFLALHTDDWTSCYGTLQF